MLAYFRTLATPFKGGWRLSLPKAFCLRTYSVPRRFRMAGLQIEKVVTALHPIHVRARDHPDTTFTFRSVRSLTQGELVVLDIDPRVVVTYKGEDGTLSTRRRAKFSHRHLAGAFATASSNVFWDLEEEGRSDKHMPSREKAERLTSHVQDQLGQVFRRHSMSNPDSAWATRNVLVWDDSAPSQAPPRRTVRSDNFSSPTLEHVIFVVSRLSQREIAWLHQSLSDDFGREEVQVKFPELQEMIDDGNSDVGDSLVLIRGTDYDGREDLLEDAEDEDEGEGQRVIERSRIVRIPEDLVPVGTPFLPIASLPSRSELQQASQRRSQPISSASAQASSEPSASSEVSSEWSAQMTPTESSTSSGQATPRATPPPSVGVPSSEEQESDLVEVFKALLVHE